MRNATKNFGAGQVLSLRHRSPCTLPVTPPISTLRIGCLPSPAPHQAQPTTASSPLHCAATPFPCPTIRSGSSPVTKTRREADSKGELAALERSSTPSYRGAKPGAFLRGRGGAFLALFGAALLAVVSRALRDSRVFLRPRPRLAPAREHSQGGSHGSGPRAAEGGRQGAGPNAEAGELLLRHIPRAHRPHGPPCVGSGAEPPHARHRPAPPAPPRLLHACARWCVPLPRRRGGGRGGREKGSSPY